MHHVSYIQIENPVVYMLHTKDVSHWESEFIMLLKGLDLPKAWERKASLYEFFV